MDPSMGNGGEEQDLPALSTKKAHVLMVATEHRTHCDIFVQIMCYLSHKHPGITVTFLSSEEENERLQKDPSKGALRNLDLRFKGVFRSTTLFLKSADAKFPSGLGKIVEDHRMQCESFTKELVARKDDPGSPTCIMASKFQYWTADLALELGIPWYPVFPSPCFALAVVESPMFVKAGLSSKSSPTSSDAFVTAVPDLVPAPFMSFVRVSDLPASFFDYPENFTKLSDCVKGSAAVIVNGSEKLDSQGGTVDGLRTLVQSSRVLTIGPTLDHPGFGLSHTDFPDTTCLHWLDSQREKSVLYVAFGTMAAMPAAVIFEMAAGIEASGLPFLWVIRLTSHKLSEVLPSGFIDRTKDRGLIQTCFVPQSKILSHAAIGGFFTHGGWNSLMESLCSGVPLIAWPMGGDQFLNVRYVIDMLKAGYAISDFKTKNQHSFEDVGRLEIGKAIRHLMLEDKEKEFDLRKNVQVIQKTLQAEVAEELRIRTCTPFWTTLQTLALDLR